MAKFYNILTASPLGEPWGEGGKNQTYWCQFEGLENNVMVNKQTPIQPGQQIYGDLLTDDGKPFKGPKSEYFKFKGAMTPPGTPRPSVSSQTPVANNSAIVPDWFIPFAKQIDYIYNEMKGVDSNQPLPLADVETYSEEVEEGGGEITPELKSKLDDIFGKREDENE